MRIKKREILNLWYIFESFKNKNYSVKFSYFIAKNKMQIKDEFDALNEIQQISDEYKLYDKKRAELAAKMADKEKDSDRPVINNNQYIITKNKKLFDIELADLKNEYSEIIKNREAQINNLNEILDDTIDFHGYKIGIEDIPDFVDPPMIEVLVITDLIIE